MKIITKIGLGFLALGFFLLGMLVFVLGRFFVGGSAYTPFQALPWLSTNIRARALTSPWREFVFFTVIMGTPWFVFVFVGAILIAVGAFQRERRG